MRAGRMKEILENVPDDALIIFEYAPWRCHGEHGRLPGIANVLRADVLYDVPHKYEGLEYTEDEVRLSTHEEGRESDVYE